MNYQILFAEKSGELVAVSEEGSEEFFLLSEKTIKLGQQYMSLVDIGDEPHILCWEKSAINCLFPMPRDGLYSFDCTGLIGRPAESGELLAPGEDLSAAS